MNFNPFEYLRDSRSMDDSLDRENTMGEDDSDRKPFSKLNKLERKGWIHSTVLRATQA